MNEEVFLSGVTSWLLLLHCRGGSVIPAHPKIREPGLHATKKHNNNKNYLTVS
jgi:hypothetical protein